MSAIDIRCDACERLNGRIEYIGDSKISVRNVCTCCVITNKTINIRPSSLVIEQMTTERLLEYQRRINDELQSRKNRTESPIRAIILED